MQFKFVAGLAAMALGASAQTTVSPDVANSVLLVLATALPDDVRNYALASSSAFAEQMGSSLSAGSTPGWYASLPADVKSILPQLYPAAVEASATSTPVVSATPTPSGSVSAIPTGSSNTTVSSVHSATLSASSSATAPSHAEHTGAASNNRVALGAGIAGAVGFLGMLAL